VLFHPVTGKAWIRRLNALDNNTIIERERNHKDSLENTAARNDDVELF